jgi:hypothetical protein
MKPPTPTTRMRLQLTGTDVQTDNAGCGLNSMKVYFAYFYEDSDRESTENMADIRVE